MNYTNRYQLFEVFIDKNKAITFILSMTRMLFTFSTMELLYLKVKYWHDETIQLYCTFLRSKIRVKVKVRIIRRSSIVIGDVVVTVLVVVAGSKSLTMRSALSCTSAHSSLPSGMTSEEVASVFHHFSFASLWNSVKKIRCSRFILLIFILTFLFPLFSLLCF